MIATGFFIVFFFLYKFAAQKANSFALCHIHLSVCVCVKKQVKRQCCGEQASDHDVAHSSLRFRVGGGTFFFHVSQCLLSVLVRVALLITMFWQHRVRGCRCGHCHTH